MNRRWSAGAVAGFAAAIPLALAGSAAAQSTALEEAGDALAGGDFVYLDPDVDGVLTADEADQLGDVIRGSGEPIFVAVLPAGEASPNDLGDEVRIEGTYVVATPDRIEAASSVIGDEVDGDAAELVQDALDSSRDAGRLAVLTDFVQRVDEASDSAVGGSSDDGQRNAADDDGEGGGGLLGPLLLVGAAGGGGYWFYRKRKRDQERQRQVTAATEDLRGSLQVLSDDVIRLDPEVAIHADARSDYEAAVSRYRTAESNLGRVRSLDDVERVRRLLDEGHYAMSRVRAVVGGYELPEPPEPLTRPGRGGEPPIVLDDQRQPAYAGGWGGPGWYGGGWYGGGGNLFTGILLGSMLGGPGFGYGGDGHGDGGDGGGGDGDGGDGGDGGGFGGGDFGGGDFGGGDFGGGDFGGGDFGGGDW